MWRIQKSLPIQLMITEMDNLTITEDKTAYNMLESCAESYRVQYGDTPIGQVYGVQYARQFFRAIGLDPTKRRPSSESLLRRALKNKPLYAINNFVDVGNWCSLDFLLPICFYDADKIDGDVEIHMGGPEDMYEALNHETISFEGRFVFSDETGPFGSPMTDSVRTSISLETTHTFLVICAPLEIDSQTLKEHGDVFVERVQQMCGGEWIMQELLKGKPL